MGLCSLAVGWDEEGGAGPRRCVAALLVGALRHIRHWPGTNPG